ncbi:hypothetical protein H0H93_006024 [Arthromyces matolae]|nr:hypothetical protein H0H93_006024 [Arthromyces matolae]
MIIIRPRNLISASLISLALLLVSATPIHSLAVSRAITNDLVGNNPVIREPFSKCYLNSGFHEHVFSVSQAPSVTEPFGHATGDPGRLQELRVVMYAASRKGCNDPDRLVDDLNEYARLVPQQRAEDLASATLYATRKVKLIVAAWNPDQRKRGIHAIMACEDAVAKDLSGKLSWRKSPQLVKDFLEEDLEPVFDMRGRYIKLSRLEDMVTYITLLTVKEQCTISKELEDGYNTIHDKVKHWADDEWKRLAMEELKKWNSLNSLVHGI